MNDDTPLETGEGDALPYSPPPPDKVTATLGLLNALEKHVDEYLGDYELRAHEGSYTPTDTERVLIADAIHGLLADDEFIALFEAWRTDANAFRALLVPPPGLTFGKVGPKMSFSIGTQSFVLDFEPEEPGEFEFMAMCLRKAFAALPTGQQTEEPTARRERLQAACNKVFAAQSPTGPYHVEVRTNACADICTADGKVFLTAAWAREAPARAHAVCALLNRQPHTEQAALVDGFDTYNSNGLAWAVSRWKDEVSQRPFLNVHRRTLDDTWRQVVRFFGGDPEALIGPAHDALVARQQHIGGNG